jgi:hypothetical protein
MVVEAVRPRGNPSTFYEVAGPHAKHALIDAYRAARSADALQIALNYQRRSAIEQLIDEAKVWSFWEYRAAYLRTHAGADRLPIESFIVTLDTWAGLHPSLAASLEHAPPASAVEDLVALHNGGLAALWAQRLLTDVMRRATSRPPEGPDTIGTPRRRDHTAHPSQPSSRPAAVRVNDSVELIKAAEPIEVDEPSATGRLQQFLRA